MVKREQQKKEKLCNNDTQLSTDKPRVELCKDVHNFEESVYNIIKSSVVYIQQLLLLSSNNPLSSSKLSNYDTQLLVRFLPRWIERLQNPGYLKIIYFLVVNGFCYTRGLVKVFGGDSSNISKQLEILKKYGIIEEIEHENRDVTRLYAQRKAFRIYNWHFNKAIFYRLTKMGKAFFCNVQFDQFLESRVIQQTDKWRKRLESSHSEIAKEESDCNKILNIWYSQWLELRQGASDVENVEWIGGRKESLAKKKGIIIKESSEGILGDFERKYEGKK